MEKLVLKSYGLAIDVTDLTHDDRNAVVRELLSRCEVAVDAFNHPSDGHAYITVTVDIPEPAAIVEPGEPMNCITVASVHYIEE